MVPILAAIMVGVLVYFLFSRLFVSRYGMNTAHTRNVLAQVMEETQHLGNRRDETAETLEILKADISQSPSLKFLSMLPMGKRAVVKIVRGGRQESAGSFLFLIIALIVAGVFGISHFKLNPLLLPLAFLLPIWFGNKMLSRNIQKRNDKFINMFPDVLDMIVRSVRSGFPINTAINMVSENMQDPVKSEFQQLADELALGRPLSEALSRLATRIDEQDIRFFVVVLKIQQETGGNLAEIISNLSGIIRKRKQLRLKIRAMTSEGRMTGYILGSIPVVVFGALMYLSPRHLDPLFETDTGNYILAAAAALIVGAQYIVRKMVNIDI